MPDVIVVGAGIIGSSIAWRLAQTSRTVTLLDRGEPGAESSSAAGGALIPEAPSLHPDLLRLYLASLRAYRGYVDEIREATGAPFEYRAPGRLYLALDDERVPALQAHARLQVQHDVRAEWLSGDDVRRLEPAVTPEQRGGVYFRDHALVENSQLSRAVAQAAARAGAEVRSHERVHALALDRDRVVGVETHRGRLPAESVVLAAGCWSSQLTPWRPDLLTPAKGQMIALHVAPRPIERMVGMAGCTIVPRADGRMMVGATRHDGDPSRDLTAEAVGRMVAYAIKLVPALAAARFADAWTGSRPLTADGLPVIGRDDDVGGLYWATGHLGMGILSAPTTAECVSALIDGQRPPVSLEAFAVSRFPVTASE